MAEARPLALSDRARIAAALRAISSPLSEYDFANLYLFRETHGYALIDAPVPYLRGRTYDGAVHALPLVPITREAVDRLLDEVDCLFPLDDEAADRAAAWGFRSEWRDADSDYVYDAARLAAMRGKALKPKRSQARAFASLEPVMTPIADSDLPDAEALLRGWLDDIARDPDDTDLLQCREALALREALGLDARLVRIAGGEPAALLIAGGERLGQRTVHFAKGRRRFAGAYPWMFSRFASDAGAARLNFEQDLGKPGFRQAKQALDPINRLRKFRIRRRPIGFERSP